MKVYSFFLLFFQFVWLPGISQGKDGTGIIKESGDVTESFEQAKYYSSKRIPFRNIIVCDKRFDTSKIGYTNSRLKIHLGASWSSILNNYFSNNLDPASNQTLVIFIKSFWLQKGYTDKIVKKKIVLKSFFGDGDLLNVENGGCCSSAIEVFAKKDSLLQALFKIDTFFLNPLANFRKNKLADVFFLPFDSLLRAMSGTDIDGLLKKRKKLSPAEVDTYYNNRFSIPVLHEPTIRKGIFMTFEEFKNNKPSENDFRLKEGKVTDELYLRNGQNEQVVDSYWGFFDGNSLYIKAGFSAFKAVRQQDTFEIYGSTQVSNYHDNPQPGDVIRFNNTAIDKKILQVNMDNGEFY